MKRERAVRPSSKRPDDEVRDSQALSRTKFESGAVLQNSLVSCNMFSLQVAEEPDLPPASLPSNFTLPKFNFSSPPPTFALSSSTTPLTAVSEKCAEKKVC